MKRSFFVLCNLFAASMLLALAAGGQDKTIRVPNAVDVSVAKGKPKITAIVVKSGDMDANSINTLKFKLKFTDDDANIFGGTLKLTVKQNNGTSDAYTIDLESTRFSKKKGTVKLSQNMLIGDCSSVKIIFQIKDGSGKSSNKKRATITVNKEDDGGGGGGGTELPPFGTQIGNRAVNFTLVNQNGQQVSLHDFKGQVILLDISTMWCGPCQAEASDAEELYQKYREQGFTILSVLFEDYGAGPVNQADCQSWANTYGLTINVLADTDETVWDTFTDTGLIPLNLVLDRDLVIRLKMDGYEEQILEDKIIELLGQ